MHTLPTTILYGDNDWLYRDGVECNAAVDSMRGAGAKVELRVIPRAGHHLYMDNAEGFHTAVCGAAGL